MASLILQVSLNLTLMQKAHYEKKWEGEHYNYGPNFTKKKYWRTLIELSVQNSELKEELVKTVKERDELKT